MINGDVMDFLNRMDRNEWTVLYKGKCYFFEAKYLPDCDMKRGSLLISPILNFQNSQPTMRQSGTS